MAAGREIVVGVWAGRVVAICGVAAAVVTVAGGVALAVPNVQLPGAVITIFDASSDGVGQGGADTYNASDARITGDASRSELLINVAADDGTTWQLAMLPPS